MIKKRENINIDKVIQEVCEKNDIVLSQFNERKYEPYSQDLEDDVEEKNQNKWHINYEKTDKKEEVFILFTKDTNLFVK